MNNFQKRFVVFDLETTNNPAKKYKHEIIEIAGIEIVGNNISRNNVFHSLVKPFCKIQTHGHKPTRISDYMLKDAPVINQVLPKFIEFIKDDPLVAHNAIFDMRILNEQMAISGYNAVSNIFFDTLVLSRKLYKTEKSHKLKTIIKRLNIEQPHKERHRALTDAEYTAMIFLNSHLFFLRRHLNSKLRPLIFAFALHFNRAIVLLNDFFNDVKPQPSAAYVNLARVRSAFKLFK